MIKTFKDKKIQMHVTKERPVLLHKSDNRRRITNESEMRLRRE